VNHEKEEVYTPGRFNPGFKPVSEGLSSASLLNLPVSPCSEVRNLS